MQARGFQWVSQLPWKNKVKCVYKCILNRTCNLNGYFLFSCSFVLLCLEIVQKSNLGKAWQMQPRGFQWTVAFSKRRKIKISHFSSNLQVVTQSCIFEAPKCNQEDFNGRLQFQNTAIIKMSNSSSDLQLVSQSCTFEAPKCNQGDINGRLQFQNAEKQKWLISARICKLSPKVAFSNLENATKTISMEGVDTFL